MGSATELVVAFVMGLGGSFKYALQALMIPVYLAKLGVIGTLSDATVKVLKSTSFGIMTFALLMGASIILSAMFRGRRAVRQPGGQEVLEEVNT